MHASAVSYDHMAFRKERPMSWVVRPYSDHDYDAIAALHDAVYPAYRTQPEVWQAATQFDHQRARPHRFVARDIATQQPIGYAALRSIRAQQVRLDLMIHPTWQRQGVGQVLLNHLIDRARTLDCVAVHMRARLDYPYTLAFLTHRGFTETHRMYGLRLKVSHANLTPFWPRVQHLAARGIAITTLVEEQQRNPAYAHHLHELQNAVAPDWPDPERVPFTPAAFDDFARRLEHETHAQPDAFFIAQASSRYIGYCGLSALGTAVHPDYRNQGVATALKVTAIADAQQRGQATVFTCTANPAMVAINEKLGYQHETVELRLGKSIT
jgi:GNAT superfamily N-acetyltransferase